MRNACLILAILCALTSATAVLADDFEDGFAALQKGEFETALRLLRPLAEQGHAKAQLNLGLMYTKGDGVPRDFVEAVGWFLKAAEQEDPKAQYCLGLAYARGDGVWQSNSDAVDWYYRAGMNYLKEGKKDDASAVHFRIESLSPGNPLGAKLLESLMGSAPASTRSSPH